MQTRVWVCWDVNDNAQMPQSRSDPAPHSWGHSVCLLPAAGFLFHPGDHLKLLPPLSRLHCPLKIPHSAIAHTAVLGRKGKSVRFWDPLSCFGTVNVISNRSPLSSAQGRAQIQSSRLSPPWRPYGLNEDNKHKRVKVERPHGGQTMRWQQETGLFRGDGDCASGGGEGWGQGELRGKHRLKLRWRGWREQQERAGVWRQSQETMLCDNELSNLRTVLWYSDHMSAKHHSKGVL